MVMPGSEPKQQRPPAHLFPIQSHCDKTSGDTQQQVPGIPRSYTRYVTLGQLLSLSTPVSSSVKWAVPRTRNC